MEIRKLLRELELNKYEANAYLVILKQGISEASVISKEGKIPFGKIYETLNTLLNKGLIEVQDIRPKKYRAKKPKLAFNTFLKEKKEYVEKDLQRTRDTLMQIEEEINKISVKEPKEKIFWTTAVGDEVGELIRTNFEEAEKEIYLLLYHKYQQTHREQIKEHLPVIISEVIKATSRGVKVKALLSKSFALEHVNVSKEFNMPKAMFKNIEVRIREEHLPAHFTIIDSEKVVLRVDDPTNSNEILAMIKIWDIRLAEKLKDKFNEIWKEAKPFKFG